MNAPIFPLQTARLRVEAYRDGDAARARAILAELSPEPFSLERARARLAAAARSYDEIGIGRGAVVLKETGETIGDAGIEAASVAGDGAYELGIVIAGSHRGRGYATELARALLAAAFGPLRLDEVRASVPLSNEAAKIVAERAGFRATQTVAAGLPGAAFASYAVHAPPSYRLPRIKMCGMTSPYDAELAVSAGADAIGLIFAPSERRVTLEAALEIVRALPAMTDRVAVFVDAPGDDVRRICEATGAIPQFSGGETLDYCERFGGERCIRVVRVGERADASAFALETERGPHVLPFFETSVPGVAGGSGRRFDWALVAAASKRGPIGISGGLTPESVAECVRLARPYAVDVRSGVERDGRKNFERMQAFVAAALAARAPAFA